MDLQKLKQNLLHSEWETARSLNAEARTAGFSVLDTVAIAYRAGLNQGRETQKANLKKAYQQLAAATERIRILEAAHALREQFANLVDNAVPNQTLEERIGAISDITNQPTPGVKQEDENNE